MALFSGQCAEPPRTDAEFGICDPQDGSKAYTDVVDNNGWDATVINADQQEVTFTAIDNCMVFLREGSKDQHRSCDGMLTTSEKLYLVELKNKGSSWISDGIEQLESTMNLIIASGEDLSRYRYKKAFVCNRKHRHFEELGNERNLRIFRTYGFRLDVHATVKI